VSRGYRIGIGAPTWRQVTWRDASTKVESSDAISMDVGMLEILPEAAMVELLRQRLAEDGWSKGQDGAMSRDFGEVAVTLAPDGRTVTARATGARDVKVRVQGDADATGKLAQASQRAERELARAVTQVLGAAEADIRAGLQAALQKVYVEALQRKAASMGQIESVHEGRGADGEIELTIKVRV
jgi:hypothetical protein